jgi:AraC-like DNA-binding protein
MAADDVDLKPRRFTTNEFPERERLSRWREEFARTIVRVDIEPLSSDVPFKAEAILQNLPGVAMASCEGSAARMHRTRALAADGGDSIGLIFNMGAAASVSQRNADLVLGDGDAVFVLTDEPGVLSSTAHLGLLFPRTALVQRLDDIDSVVMRSIPHRDGSLRLLLSYLRLNQDDVGSTPPALQETIISHIHDLAALAIGANRDVREQGKNAVAAARLTAAIDYIGKDYIGKHFADPALTLASVAHHQQISPRYLQELLEQSGASFVARVNELRLKRAFVLITRLPERPVSGIAASAGFSNISHFNRLFRQRYGDSPSGVRSRS